MKIKLTFAELHTPLFLAGTNLQTKLKPTERGGLVLIYDDEREKLLVYWNKQLAVIPHGNVACMHPEDPTIFGEIEEGKPAKAPVLKPGKPIKAQVSTPQDHVFAGEGAGQTNA